MTYIPVGRNQDWSGVPADVKTLALDAAQRIFGFAQVIEPYDRPVVEVCAFPGEDAYEPLVHSKPPEPFETVFAELMLHGFVRDPYRADTVLWLAPGRSIEELNPENWTLEAWKAQEPKKPWWKRTLRAMDRGLMTVGRPIAAGVSYALDGAAWCGEKVNAGMVWVGDRFRRKDP